MLSLCVVNLFKAMVYWIPERFRIVSSILHAFVNSSSLLLLLLTVIVYFIPAVLALLSFAQNVYRFSDLAYVYERILVLSIGGFIFNSGTHYHMKEDLPYV